MTTVATTVATEAATANADFERTAAGRPNPGRPAALLAELFDAHAPMVLGLCRSLLRDRHEAEDAAQQAFLSAYGSLLSGTVPREPAAWLATIARNECRTRSQRRMREPLPVAEAQEACVEPAASTAAVESLRIALAQLPRQQRHAFFLREFHGLSYAELAVALEVTRPAVESLLFRARQQLRGALRAAAAAAVSAPASVREFVTQLLTGPVDGSGAATAAKLGSLPLVAKLASIGAGTALITAGAVAVSPVRHHHQQLRVALAPARAVQRPERSSLPASPPAAPVLVAARAQTVSPSPPQNVPAAPARRDVSQPVERDRGGSGSSGGKSLDEHTAPAHVDESGSANPGPSTIEPADAEQSFGSHDSGGSSGDSGSDGGGDSSGSGSSGGDPTQPGD